MAAAGKVDDGVFDSFAANVRLNSQVARMAAKHKESVASGATKADAVLLMASQEKTALWAGTPVYENRRRFPIVLCLAFCAYGMVSGAMELGAVRTLVCAVASFIAYGTSHLLAVLRVCALCGCCCCCLLFFLLLLRVVFPVSLAHAHARTCTP
jgi:hypothetical protein